MYCKIRMYSALFFTFLAISGYVKRLFRNGDDQ